MSAAAELPSQRPSQRAVVAAEAEIPHQVAGLTSSPGAAAVART